MKHLHRLIVTSDAYRRASGIKSFPESTDAAANSRDSKTRTALATLQRLNASADPENVHLWRMNSGQMEAEVVRDSLLYLAGELDATFGGYPVPNTEAEKSKRRTLYLECFPEEGGHSEFSKLFDPPDPADCYRRSTTVIPQQALALSNSHLARDQSTALARKLAERLAGASSGTNVPPLLFIQVAYEQILTRSPTAEEIRACVEFLSTQEKLTELTEAKLLETRETRESAPLAQSRASLVHALFSHHDFLNIR